MRTLYNSLLPQVALTSVLRGAGTVNGTAVDTNVFANVFTAVTFVVQTAAITDGSHAITIEDSDDNSSWGAVNAALIQGTPPTITSTHDNVLFHFGLTRTEKRYVRLVATTTGGATGGVFGAIAILGNNNVSPPARS